MAGKQRKSLTGLWVAGLTFSFLAMGCTSHPTDAQLKQQAEQTTQQVKQDAQQAAANTRAAAANAADKIDAVAAGVKEGLQSGQSPQLVNLNTASKRRLETLPGITPAVAGRIVAGRPYSLPDDLATRGILTQDQFDRISSKVTVPPPAS